MTTMPEEKKKSLECLWCHNFYDAAEFTPEDPADRPYCPRCGEPLTLVDAGSPGEPVEASRAVQDEEVSDYWLSSNWD